MKIQHDNIIFSSFYLFLDDKLVKTAEAVVTGKHQTFKYHSVENKPSGFNAFYSPIKQFAANHILAPSGCTVNGTGIYQNTLGPVPMLIDHEEGRILLSTQVPTTATISGNFVEREVNLYITNDSQEEIILNKDFYESGTEQTFLESSDNEDKKRYSLPAIFLTNHRSENKPFALGGVDDTKNYFKVVVAATNNFYIDSILGLLRDFAHKNFKIIDYSSFPYGSFWNIKQPPYNYNNLIPTKYSYIDSVMAYRIKEKLSSRLGKAILFGCADITISSIRKP